MNPLQTWSLVLKEQMLYEGIGQEKDAHIHQPMSFVKKTNNLETKTSNLYY